MAAHAGLAAARYVPASPLCPYVTGRTPAVDGRNGAEFPRPTIGGEG
ncbi:MULTISPECIES: hypothetical protein [Streptomyces]|nr:MULTISPECIES: hypothetical protein [Streptomyces]